MVEGVHAEHRECAKTGETVAPFTDENIDYYFQQIHNWFDNDDEETTDPHVERIATLVCILGFIRDKGYAISTARIKHAFPSVENVPQVLRDLAGMGYLYWKMNNGPAGRLWSTERFSRF